MAEAYCAQGRYSESEPLYQRALDIQERNLGADHPNLAATLDDLAALYTEMGRPDAAIAAQGRAQAIRANAG